MSDEEVWELISVSANLKNNDLYYLASKELLRRYPENASATLNCLWYSLIIKKDESQLSLMDEFAQKHPEYLPDSCRYAIDFLSQNNREEETAPYYERLENWEYVRNAAEDERALVLASDEYKPHELPPETIENFAQYFARHPIISSVYMAQKIVKYMPEYPSLIIAYKTKAHFWVSKKSVNEQVMNFIYNSGLPSAYSFIELNSVNGLKRKISKVQGASVYKK